MTVLQLTCYVIVMLGWSIFQVHKLLSLNQRNAAVVFSCLMGMGVIAGSLFITHVPLPSSTTPLRNIFEPIGKMILR